MILPLHVTAMDEREREKAGHTLKVLLPSFFARREERESVFSCIRLLHSILEVLSCVMSAFNHASSFSFFNHLLFSTFSVQVMLCSFFQGLIKDVMKV